MSFRVIIIGANEGKAVFCRLQAINDRHTLPLMLSFCERHKLSDKELVSFANDHPDVPIIAIIKQVPTLIKVTDQGIIKSPLNWQSLTKRIVGAGRKSELILQASKLTSGMSVMDGTAGFGHDGLILASTGASVMMMERHPLMALLLLFEHEWMSRQVNWQKLLSRIQIYHGDFLDAKLMATLPKVDMVYLDPMFPKNSYSSKVNKNMQVLHDLSSPPSGDDESLLLNMAKQQLSHQGKIIVKRPILAPYLAKEHPIQSIANDAVRFDRY